jgi:hypothetical protein
MRHEECSARRTLSVNGFNFLQYRSCALGKEHAGSIVRGIGEENGSYTRHRNTEEHEKLKRWHRKICILKTINSNEVTYLMEEADVLEGKACREKHREN